MCIRDSNSTSRFVGGGPPNGGGSGGGGHSYHRCPKCGASVTFQDSSKNNNNKGMQNNCFYCAACSGWFLVKPTSTTSNNSSSIEMDESKYLLSKMAAAASAAEGNGEKIVGAPPSNRKISQPQFVMQHVSWSFVSWLLLFSCISCHQYTSHLHLLLQSNLIPIRCQSNPTPEIPPIQE